MHNFFRVYWISHYMFRTVFSSINRSPRLYIQRQVYEMELLSPISCPLASSQRTLWHIPDAVCTVLDSRWWTERPSETCRVIFNKLEKNCASCWFYYRNRKICICKVVLLEAPWRCVVDFRYPLTGRNLPMATLFSTTAWKLWENLRSNGGSECPSGPFFFPVL
jgi:hypothetical protein